MHHQFSPESVNTKPNQIEYVPTESDISHFLSLSQTIYSDNFALVKVPSIFILHILHNQTPFVISFAKTHIIIGLSVAPVFVSVFVFS